MSKPSLYAYVCVACHHYVSDHRMALGGTTVDGPYQCAACGCEIGQNSPMHRLSKREYEAREAAHGDMGR